MTDHGHGHGHAHGGDPFDEKAVTWDDDPAKVARSAALADAIAAAAALSPSTRFLELGAGTGLLPQALGDRVAPPVLVDSSAGMRAAMEAKVASGALAAGTRVLGSLPPPDERFDVIATVMVLHHIPDLDGILRQLAARLDEGGRLCIADLEIEDGSFHGDDFDGHHGFDPVALTEHLRAAGLADVDVRRGVTRADRHGTEYPVFLLVAGRSAG